MRGRIGFEMLRLCVLLLVATSTQAARVFSEKAAIEASEPKPPRWADAYMVEFVVSMPDMFIMQPQGFSIPVKAWYDGPRKESRVESFGGIDAVYKLRNAEYDVHPRIDQLKCWSSGNGASNGADPILPDISDWKYGGEVELEGKAAQIWKLEFKQGEQVSTYAFYTAVSDGAPLKLHMFGRNLIENSHFDEYLYDFTAYAPFTSGTSNDAFVPPEICKNSFRVEGGQRHWLSRQMEMLTPVSRSPGHANVAVDAAYAQWSLLHQRGAARSPVELQQRLERFRQAHAKVAAHNANPEKTYTMHLGRFADWSDEEYYGTLMPDAWRRKQGLPSRKEARQQQQLQGVQGMVPHADKPLGKFKRRMSDRSLPKEVDWRGTGVDAGVKDQGYCGSCYTFAATGTMEGAWYLSTGERQSFSEQQMVDCAFDWGVDACDGGEAEAVINYVANSGGISLEQDYYYKGMVDYCRASNFTRVAQFDGFLEVESRDEKALMEAVYTLGPVAVGVDASPDSFGYYKEGVYTDAQCSNYDLDHAVVLYGYGTSDEGIDYWLVKNSWSKLFGTDGFIKIARGSRDCGISTEASVAVVAKDLQRDTGGRLKRISEAVGGR